MIGTLQDSPSPYGDKGIVAEFRAGSEFPLSPLGLSYALNLGSAEGIEAVHQRDADLDFGGLTIRVA